MDDVQEVFKCSAKKVLKGYLVQEVSMTEIREKKAISHLHVPHVTVNNWFQTQNIWPIINRFLARGSAIIDEVRAGVFVIHHYDHSLLASTFNETTPRYLAPFRFGCPFNEALAYELPIMIRLKFARCVITDCLLVPTREGNEYVK